FRALICSSSFYCFFFFNLSSTTEIYTLSLHDALPIFFDLVIGKILTSRLSLSKHLAHNLGNLLLLGKIGVFHNRRNASSRLLLLISKHLILCIYLVFRILRSEERFSRNAETDLVCRLLLEKKKKIKHMIQRIRRLIYQKH